MKPEIVAKPETNPEEREILTRADRKPVVLVTGSTGFIGSKVIEAFAANYQVVGLDLKRPKESVAGADWIECDVTRDESVVRSLAAARERYGESLASVIHLAAYYDFSGEPSPLYRTLTVEGTRRLLRALQQFKVEQFVFSSTLLVMKPVEQDEVITERSMTESEEEMWDYPRSKIEAERVIQKERGTIPAVIARIAGVYDENCHSIPIAQQISRIYENRLESYFFPGDASHGQAFVHLNDLVDALRKVVALRREFEPHEVLLIAEPDVMSYAELQDRIGELIHGQEWPAIRIPKVVAKAGAWVQEKMAGEGEAFIKPWMVDLADAHYPVEIGRARQILGWEPQHRLRNTLSRMIGDLKTDPRQWYQKNKLNWPEDEQARAANKK
jgi:nucleoside-diphosphate-sugar epimerase